MFRKKEWERLGVVVLVLSFIFAFNDGRDVFVLRFWLGNFFRVLIFVILAYGLHVFVQKKYAKSLDCKSEYKLWKVQRFWFGKGRLKHKVPIGIFLGITLAFYSYGQVFFTGLGSLDIKGKLSRLGQKFQFVTDIEIAKCALIGNVANIALVAVLSVLGNLGLNFGDFTSVNLWIVVFNMIPIPPLDGGKIFFRSRTLYMFGVGFVVLSFLLRSLGLLGSIGLSAILAFVIMAIYYYRFEI